MIKSALYAVSVCVLILYLTTGILMMPYKMPVLLISGIAGVEMRSAKSEFSCIRMKSLNAEGSGMLVTNSSY